MLYSDRINTGKEIDLAKSNNGKECMDCHYWHFNHGFKFLSFLFYFFFFVMVVMLWQCWGLNISNIAIISVKNVDYCCIIHDIKIMCLMIVSKYKMHINIKNQICNFSTV